MSRIINRSGAESDLFRHLRERGIHGFSSIDEMAQFKRNYHREIADFKEVKAAEVEQEIKDLTREIEDLRTEYERSHAEHTKFLNNETSQLKARISLPPRNLFERIKRYFAARQLRKLENHFEQIVGEALRKLRRRIDYAAEQLTDLTVHKEDVIARRAAPFVAEIERTATALTEFAPVIYGAVGELKAIELLRKLPDNYYVINDYRRSFHRPLHMRQEDDWIYSIQLDHVVIGPTGVFVIETKYWSTKSIANNNLFSPVKQLRRGGFALFIVLNEAARSSRAFNNHWGAVQISVGNILLMMNATTNEQFQFVKILTEFTLLDHITRRPAVFTPEQVECLIDNIRR